MRKTISAVWLVLSLLACSPAWAQGQTNQGPTEEEIIRKCLGLGHWSMVRCVELERARQAQQPAPEETQAPKRTLEEAAQDKNPIPADAKSIEQGKTVYQQYCFTCHGENGRGGPAAEFFQKPVPDLTNPYTQKNSDGALFWKITGGRVPMPAFGDFLTKEDVWNAINYIRTFSKQANAQ